MQPIEFIAPYYYSTVYYIVLLVLSWATTLYYVGSNGQKLLYKHESDPSQGAAIFFTILLIFFVGLRQYTRDFGDTQSYAHRYDVMIEYMPVSFKTEWFWNNMQTFCRTVLGLNSTDFFTVVSFGFFGGMLFCSIKWTGRNLWLAILFFCTTFQTFSFAVNGIRNGLGCSLLLIAISLMEDKSNKPKLLCILILMSLALGIHRSTLLPSVVSLLSFFFIKDTKFALRFWLASIAISLVAGNAVENFFASLGFDDRMGGYSNAQFDESNADRFSHTGFRWDFLLYSTFPVIMIWYVTHIRRFNNPTFNLIANTYLFCNAFWIMVIRAAYSNRFAYLSWFIYPMVIAYPLLRMNIWKDQDRRTALILFAYSGFTFFMFFIYYFGTTGFKGFDQYWWK